MTETFTYDDPDGSFEIEVGDESLEFRYESNGEWNTVSIRHVPIAMDDFCTFLLNAAHELQAELGRQELEQLKLIPKPRRL